MYLVKQLLRNTSHHSLAALSCIAAENIAELSLVNQNSAGLSLVSSKVRSPSLDLLMKFQRLLITELYSSSDSSGDQDTEHRSQGVLALLRKYLSLICAHVTDILPTATNIGNTSQKHFHLVSLVLEQDIIGHLLPELVICLLVVQVEQQSVFSRCELVPSLTCITQSLDKFNMIAPGHEKEESDELVWPGFSHSQQYKHSESESPNIR